jgi:hypothetical protein
VPLLALAEFRLRRRHPVCVRVSDRLVSSLSPSPHPADCLVAWLIGSCRKWTNGPKCKGNSTETCGMRSPCSRANNKDLELTLHRRMSFAIRLMIIRLWLAATPQGCLRTSCHGEGECVPGDSDKEVSHQGMRWVCSGLRNTALSWWSVERGVRLASCAKLFRIPSPEQHLV